MSQREHREDGEDGGEQEPSGSRDGGPLFGEDAAAWVAASTLRVGLALLGLVLLLFALGQVAGLDLLGLVVDAISTDVGRWLVVALFALVIIYIAARGFGTRSG